ncbi:MULTISPECIES: FtsQ-type POTRA domain-containing protein [unclassified Actinomyces]|uniref:cell division protein FtsQ/DivIB n=2 Tax=unclassified Actinomyces TaxID=2609248 RepID=UPI00201716BF
MRRPGAPRPELPVDPDEAAGPDGADDAPRWDRAAVPGGTEEGGAVSAGRPGAGAGRMAGALAGRRTDVPEGALSVFGRRSRELAQDAAGEGGVAARTGWDRVVSTGLEDRRRERERAERQLRLRRLGTVLAVLVAAAVLVWGIGFSPLLALRGEEVRVTGSDGTVEVSQVRQALAGHEGTSLVRLDPAGMGQEVAAALVRVRSARVTRSWPHGVEVALTMRVPVAARQTEAGYEVLDGEAVVLEVVEAAPAGTALITHEGDEPLGQDQVTAVALVVGCLDTATRGQVASASASGTGQVTLVLTSGATVFWGDTSQSVLKAEVLRSLLTRQASTYDVSSPHSPTTS